MITPKYENQLNEQPCNYVADTVAPYWDGTRWINLITGKDLFLDNHTEPQIDNIDRSDQTNVIIKKHKR